MIIIIYSLEILKLEKYFLYTYLSETVIVEVRNRLYNIRQEKILSCAKINITGESKCNLFVIQNVQHVKRQKNG